MPHSSPKMVKQVMNDISTGGKCAIVIKPFVTADT